MRRTAAPAVALRARVVFPVEVQGKSTASVVRPAVARVTLCAVPAGARVQGIDKEVENGEEK